MSDILMMHNVYYVVRIMDLQVLSLIIGAHEQRRLQY